MALMNSALKTLTGRGIFTNAIFTRVALIVFVSRQSPAAVDSTEKGGSFTAFSVPDVEPGVCLPVPSGRERRQMAKAAIGFGPIILFIEEVLVRGWPNAHHQVIPPQNPTTEDSRTPTSSGSPQAQRAAPYISDRNLGQLSSDRFPENQNVLSNAAHTLRIAMLAESNIPLIIDQPEDDVDSAFTFSAGARLPRNKGTLAGSARYA